MKKYYCDRCEVLVKPVKTAEFRGDHFNHIKFLIGKADKKSFECNKYISIKNWEVLCDGCFSDLLKQIRNIK